METASAQVVGSSLEHRVAKLDRQDASEERKVFLDQLLLEIDRMGRNDRFFLVANGKQNGGNEIGKALAYAGTRFGEQVRTIHQGVGDGHRHLLLFGSILKVLGLGKDPGGRKNFLDLPS